MSLGDFEFYQNFTGVGTPADAPTFLPLSPFPGQSGTLPFEVSDPSGLRSVAVLDPSGASIIPQIAGWLTASGAPPTTPIDPSNISGSTTTIDVAGSFNTTMPGLYTFTVTNVAGARTVAYFTRAAISADLDYSKSRAGYDPTTGNWTWNATLAAAASQGIDQINELSTSLLQADGPITASRSFAGATGAQISYAAPAPVSVSTPGFSAEVVDVDGNWEKFSLALSTGADYFPSAVDFTSPLPPGSSFTNASFQIVPAPGNGNLNTGGDQSGLVVNGTGIYASPIYDLVANGGFPGGLLRAGVWVDPVTGSYSTTTLIGYNPGFGPTLITTPQPVQTALLNVQVAVVTGNRPDLSDGVSETLFSGTLSQPAGAPFVPPAVAVPLSRYYRMTMTATNLVDPAKIYFCRVVRSSRQRQPGTDVRLSNKGVLPVLDIGAFRVYPCGILLRVPRATPVRETRMPKRTDRRSG